MAATCATGATDTAAGWAMADARQWEEARAAFDCAIEAGEATSDAFSGRSYVLTQLGRVEDALADAP